MSKEQKEVKVIEGRVPAWLISESYLDQAPCRQIGLQPVMRVGESPTPSMLFAGVTESPTPSVLSAVVTESPTPSVLFAVVTVWQNYCLNILSRQPTPISASDAGTPHPEDPARGAVLSADRWLGCGAGEGSWTELVPCMPPEQGDLSPL